jgi:hypothetical protein
MSDASQRYTDEQYLLHERREARGRFAQLEPELEPIIAPPPPTQTLTDFFTYLDSIKERNRLEDHTL